MSLSFAPTALASKPENRVQLIDRELDIIAMIVEGLSDDEISARLRLTPSEVSRLVSCLYAKLGVGDRLELIIHAYYSGIAKPR